MIDDLASGPSRSNCRATPNCDRRHCNWPSDVPLCCEEGGAIVIPNLTYNPVLIDERNEQPLLIAFVATVAVWAVALLLAVA